MNAREDILSAIRARRAAPGTADIPPAAGPEAHGPRATGDNLADFSDRAKAGAAQVKVLENNNQIPAAISEILRSRNLPAVIHLTPDRLLDQIPWGEVPGLSITRIIPGGENVAVAIAPYAIAETGTLVYPASPVRPPSWHFRPGMEIALLAADRICETLEHVLQRITTRGALPSTVNLVTGPSRTGDIEQTLERGAHGPRELVILIVPSLGGEHP